jgi:hypothetical protein
MNRRTILALLARLRPASSITVRPFYGAEVKSRIAQRTTSCEPI